MTTTLGPSSSASSALKVRPSAGLTPRAVKYPLEARMAVTRSGSPSPVSVPRSSKGVNAPSASNEVLRST